MAFVTIEVKIQRPDTPLADYVFSEARQHSLLRALQTYLSNELKRDFDTIKVELAEHEKGSLIVATCANPFSGRPMTPEERSFLDQLADMLAPEYIIAEDGQISTTAGTAIPGLGIDWRGVMMAVAQQGTGFLPGLIESVRSGAEEILKAKAALEAKESDDAGI